MANQEFLRVNDYYLWKKNITYSNFPWDRSYLNIEFLEYEKKRICKVEEWYKDFNRSDNKNTWEKYLFTSYPYLWILLGM